MSLFSILRKTFGKNLLYIASYISKNPYKVFIFSGIFYIFYRISPFANKTEIYCKETFENKKICENLEPFNYTPTIWMPFASMQILFHESMPKKIVHYKREYFTSTDQGEYSLDWVVDDPREFSKNKNKKILLILHGLTGGSQTIYMRDIISEMKKMKDFKICVLHNRGINDTPLRTPKAFNAAFTKDIDHVIKMLKIRFPEMPLYTMGISMGANILTKYFSNEYDLGNYVKCFISLSNPFDFQTNYLRIKNSLLEYILKVNLQSFFHMHPILRNVKGLEEHYKSMEKFKNYKDLDNAMIPKIFPEFSSADDYYTRGSSKDDLKNLKVRTIFFNAKDDILSPVYAVDLNQFQQNEKIIMILTNQGSHICWFSGFFTINRWFIRKCINYIRSISEIERT